VSHQPFETKLLPTTKDAVALDGSDVRVLLAGTRGSLAHFELPAGETSVAVRHQTVEEIWYFLQGRGEMWRRLDGHEQTVEVCAGVCITIPVGTAFQFRARGEESRGEDADGADSGGEDAGGEDAGGAEQLAAIGATMPPWPGPGEAVIVDGPWKPTLPPGPI
jgi:mannose-6-phosphate isomerase-like protein (cupin superfamily)